MDPMRVGADRGWGWIGDGWRLFTASPGRWLVLVILWVLIGMACNLVPLIGPLLIQLISPALAGGLLLCAADAEKGRTLDPGRLFDPLTDAASRGPMLVLGALFLAANLVALFAAGVVALGSVGIGLLGQHGALMDPGGPTGHAMSGQMMAQVGLGMLLAVLVSLVIGVVAWALFFYAIPLVVFRRSDPIAAIGLSVRGILRNWLPLLVIGVLWLVLSIIATLPLLLGWLILLPVTFGAWYASYGDLFPPDGSPDPAPALPGDRQPT